MLSQTDAQLREMTANYYGMISLIDHNVGRLLAALAETGELENTYVFFTSDHGDFMGDHGLYLKGPMLYEGLLNVGLIAVGPGIKSGEENDTVISTLDLAATFADIAGSNPARGMGRTQSFSNLGWRGRWSPQARFCEWRVGESRCGVPLRLTCVHDGRYKLTYESTSKTGELYDLETDPEEMTDLWTSDRAKDLRERLMQLIQEREGLALSEFADPVGMT